MELAEIMVLEDHVKLGTDMANKIVRGLGPPSSFSFLSRHCDELFLDFPVTRSANLLNISFAYKSEREYFKATFSLGKFWCALFCGLNASLRKSCKLFQ